MAGLIFIISHSYIYRINSNQMRISLLIFTLAFTITARAQKDKIYTDFNDALKHPSAVYHLDLNHQGLSEIDPKIGLLVNLVYLDAGANQISSLPKEIGNLVNLKELHLF